MCAARPKKPKKTRMYHFCYSQSVLISFLRDVIWTEVAHPASPHYLNTEMLFLHTLHNQSQVGLFLAHVPLLMFNFSL